MQGQEAKLPTTVKAVGTAAAANYRQDEEAQTTGATRQFVTFEIAEEEYGVDIMAVREIKAWSGTTKLPNSAKYMRGVINLRGVIVPIFDLRARFGEGLTEATKTHVVIIVAVDSRIIGILVDAVSDILTIPENEIQPVPRTDRTIDAQFLQGLVSINERMVALLSVEQLFELEDLKGASDIAASMDIPQPGGAHDKGERPH